jgi:hypothetical protein
MQRNSKTPVVVGAILHVLPENLTYLHELLENSPYVQRLIIFKESNNKLWIIEREEFKNER